MSSQTICTMRSPERRTVSIMRGLLAATGAAPGSVMPSASHTTCMELAVPMPEHTPGPRIAFSLMPLRSSALKLAGEHVPGRQKHVLDIDVLALVFAARLIAADHHDGGKVRARRGHELARRRLVAGRQTHHAVELRALHRDLDVVGDQVAAGQADTSPPGRRW